jgi:acyl-coenzyme A synthetase/AMP-(fatty) acid ligase
MSSNTKGILSKRLSIICNANYKFSFQISPTELEEIIGRHPMVKDSGVTSIWDDVEGTEIPLAFVVPKTPILSMNRERLAKEIRDLVAGEVAGYKKLRGGVWFIDQLPRNPTGKMLRRELREKAALKAHL